jgi:pyruvate dehydrogenase E2 component (dihydrolipoamide acetyltransferase)
MQTKVIMPQMGESIVEGTITKWLKKVGDMVQRDEALFEISTDKVDSEIPSPAAGFLHKILVPEGQTVQVNTVLAVIEGEVPADAGPPAPAVSPVARAEAPAPTAASTMPVGPTLDATAAPLPEPTAKPIAAMTFPASGPRDIRTSPLVRRIARENNVDIALVSGTGLDGRITKDDILNYLAQTGVAAENLGATVAVRPVPEQRMEEQAESVATRPDQATGQAPSAREGAPQDRAVVESARPEEDAEAVPMTQMRKMIAAHMVLSKTVSAHVSTVFEVDMTGIVKLREKSKDEFEQRQGVKLTFTPFFVKALVETVREYPVFNSSVSGDSIIYRKAIHVGVAVALDKGLIVPVVREAHLKSFTGLVLAINDLAQKARTKRLKPEEAQNGTISITNPGIYGPLFATPIINQPLVAILGVGGIDKRPVVVEDAIAIRSMVYLSLSFDHRVIDGALADQFMAHLKANLQAWTHWRE